jgi:hypothetical protein
MEFAELDRELSRALNLEEGCVFLMRLNKSDKMFEFLYPHELKGSTIPVLDSCIAGKAVIYKRPFVLNNTYDEIDTNLNCQTKDGVSESSSRIIAYSIYIARRIWAVLLVVGRHHNRSDLQDFNERDLQTIEWVLEKMIYLQLVKSA